MRNRDRFLPLALALLSPPGCGYNPAVAADEPVKAAWANVESAYQQRADLAPKLVAVVKGSAPHEEAVLTEVVVARVEATQVEFIAEDITDPDRLRAFEAAQDRLSSSLGRLLAVSESYPDLKANASFRDLHAQLEGIQGRIAIKRRRYNEAVEEYNRVVRQFPTSWGAGIAHLKTRDPVHGTAPETKAAEAK
jgi:LemA protein